MVKSKIILFIIILLAFLLRFVNLGHTPVGFTPDEASQGYTAYSLLETGRDEWGSRPSLVSFRSFLDYKAPLQTYLMMPGIALFGLNEFSVRLPSAIFGVLAVIVIYLLTNQLFSSSRSIFGSFNLGHLAALALATSPWHIQFSRMALEVNLLSFLFPLGILLFLLGFKHISYWYYSAVVFSLSLYAYHSSKIVVPLMILSLVVVYKDFVFAHLRQFTLSILIFLLISLPQVSSVLTGGNQRGSELLFTRLSIEEKMAIDDSAFYSPLWQVNPLLARAFHNKYTYLASKFAENYLSYFSLSYWFTEGGREITYAVIPGRGLLLFSTMPLLILGLIYLFKQDRKIIFLMIAWFLIAILPASLTKEGYRPNRSGMLLGLPEILIALGFYYLVFELKFKKIALGFSLATVVLFGFYLQDLFFGWFVKYPTAMARGWREVMTVAKPLYSQYDHVYLERGGQSQVFPAFYLPIPPNTFQTASAGWWRQITDNPDIKYLDQLGYYKLDKHIIKELVWPEDSTSSALYITSKFDRLPAHRHTIHQVVSADGKPLIELFDFATP